MRPTFSCHGGAGSKRTPRFNVNLGGDSRLYLGASPRAGIALLRVAKARALSEGRDYVAPDDVHVFPHE